MLNTRLKIYLHRLISHLLITAFLFQLVSPILVVKAAETPKTEDPIEATRHNEPLPPQEESAWRAITEASQDIRELAMYADARQKLKLNPIDTRELDRWLEVNRAIKALEQSDPETYAEFVASNYSAIPDSIQAQFGLEKRPLAVFGKEVLQGLFLLVTDQTAHEAGAGGDYLEISRLLADYDSEKKSVSREGEEKDEEILERTISSHYEEHVEAADLAAYDYILCTKLTIEKDQTNSQMKITKREKQPGIPIEFIWQSEAERKSNLGGTGSTDGSLMPNTLGGLLGVNPADLFRRVVRDNVLGELLSMLSSAGFSLQPEDLLLSRDWSVGTTELSDVYDRLSQAVFRDIFGASIGGSPLRFGSDLPDTIDRTGAAILAQAFPKFSADAIGGANLSEWAERNARASLGERLVDAGFRIDGDTGRDIARNLGLQYFTAKVLNLAPTTDLTFFPTNSPQAIRSAIGRIAASQKLGVRVDRLGADMLTDPTIADARLNLLPGTSARFTANELSVEQYFELVGEAVITTSLGAYADNPNVRMQAAGLSIVFGPEDVFVPDSTRYGSVAEELQDLEKLYRSRLNDADWQFFAARYKSASSTELDEITEIQTYLATHLREASDLLTPIFAGSATDDTWVEIGLRTLAKVDPKPLAQLGILTYLQTGVMPTIAIQGASQRSPIADIDLAIGERLGLLPGDYERIRTDRFSTEVLPRVANDLFLEALGYEGAAGSLNGAPRSSNLDDDFLRTSFTRLADQLQGVRDLSSEGETIRNNLVNRLRSLTSADWTETAAESRSFRLGNLLTSLGGDLLTLKPHLAEGDRTGIFRQFAGIVAGRELPDLTTVSDYEFTGNRSLGLTKDYANDLLAGRVSPNQAKRQVGANYLANYLWNVEDPEKMAKDLLRVAEANTVEILADFARDYSDNFTDMANLLEETIALSGSGKMTGEQFFQLFTGNRLPLFGRLGAMLYEGTTGQAGSIFTDGGDTFLRATGLNQLLDASGWIGTLESLGESVANIPRVIAEQSLGLTWADNPADFLKANGPDMFLFLGAPPQLVDQFKSVWDPNNPEAALALLKQPNFWAGVTNMDQVFKNTFGNDIGGTMAGQFREIFLSGRNPAEVLNGIKNNPERFFPDIAEALGVPFDPTNLYRAIKTGNEAGLQAELVGLGSQFIDRRIDTLHKMITSNDHSPETMLGYATTLVPQFFGDPAIAGLAGMGIALNNYFAGGQTDTATLLAAAGQFGSAIGIPYVADAALIFSDPRGFGTSYAAATITAQLNSTFGGGYIDYGTVRNALFGPDPGIFAAEAAGIRQQIENSPEMFAAFSSLSPESQQLLVEGKIREKMAKIQGEAQQNLMFQVTDAAIGMPPGFTKTMISGSDNQRLDALFIAADRLLGGLPPEARVALELIKSKGDLTQIENLTYAYLDGQLSNVIGIPLPPGFTKNAADFVTGKISFDKMTENLGPFAIGQVSGALDQQLGLPVGTTYQIYQVVNQVGELTSKIDSLQSQIQDAFFTGDEATTAALQGELAQANANLARLEAGLASFAVNFAFGEQINNLEQSLGLPAGTVNFLINGAMQSIFTGGSFMGILGAAFPMFAAGILIGKFIGIKIPGLGGGGSQQVTWCSPGGYYPYVKPTKDADGKVEEGVFDPNGDLDIYDPKKRLKPEEVQKKLDLWPGYVGEFMGKDSNPESYEWGKRAAARWKVREITGKLLLMPEKTEDERMQPNQLILYSIPDAARGKDGDYLKYYDGRETTDERFIRTNFVGDTLGVVDWPYPWDKPDYPLPGYGDGTPNSGNAVSPDSLQQKHYGNFNVGLWVERAEEYRHHIHYGG